MRINGFYKRTIQVDNENSKYLILNIEAKIKGVSNKLLESEMERKYMMGYKDGLEAAIDYIKKDLSNKKEGEA